MRLMFINGIRLFNGSGYTEIYKAYKPVYTEVFRVRRSGTGLTG